MCTSHAIGVIPTHVLTHIPFSLSLYANLDTKKSCSLLFRQYFDRGFSRCHSKSVNYDWADEGRTVDKVGVRAKTTDKRGGRNRQIVGFHKGCDFFFFSSFSLLRKHYQKTTENSEMYADFHSKLPKGKGETATVRSIARDTTSSSYA